MDLKKNKSSKLTLVQVLLNHATFAAVRNSAFSVSSASAEQRAALASKIAFLL